MRMAGGFVTDRRVHFRQIVQSLTRLVIGESGSFPYAPAAFSAMLRNIMWVAVFSLVAFGVGWVAGHVFRRGASPNSGSNPPDAIQAAENTATPELRHTNTSQIEVADLNSHRWPFPNQEPAARSSGTKVRAHTSAKVPVPQDTRNFPASSFASLAPSQAESDVNKVAPPSVTVPSDGLENILPFFNVPEPCLPIAPPPPQSAAALPDSLQPGALINKVEPQYPAAALAQKVEGVVKIYVVTGEDGSIKRIRPLSGPQMLIPAALEAVRQWRYSPTLLSGQPIESQRQITVAFQIAKTPLEPVAKLDTRD
jgi:TonB family protein